MDLGLKEKVALVLAASKGLGRASAAALAAEGASVTIGARNKQVLEQTAQELQRDTGSRVLAVPADVTRAEDIDALVRATINAFGRIDILVNNAGGPPFGTFEQFDDAQWQAAFELHLLIPICVQTDNNISRPHASLAVTESVQQVQRTIQAEIGDIDVLVNNAAVYPDEGRSVLEVELETFHDCAVERKRGENPLTFHLFPSILLLIGQPINTRQAKSLVRIS